MSATIERARRSSVREDSRYHIYVATVAAAALGALAIVTLLPSSGIEMARARPWDVLTWTVLVACSACLPIPSGRGAWLSLDLPLLLGAGFVFGPAVAGAIGLLGAWDMRELRREVSFARAVFNHSQVALSAIVGAAVFGVVGGQVGAWPLAGLAALLGLLADCAVNYSLVAGSISITNHRPFASVLTDMRLGPVRSFVPAYLALGLVAVLIAEAYSSLGIAGILASIAPVLLARQAFQASHELDDANALLRLREGALNELDSRIARERRDERLVLAGEIHDEVLPPLFKVHLMGQVLKQDLSSGRLLDLDEDLPQLLEATEAAQSAIRDLLGDLRRSPLGAGGLGPTVRLLASQLESVGSPRLVLEIEDVDASAKSQLLAYQVIREALNNAAKYSKATQVKVRVWEEDDAIRLLVEDDGVGFDPRGVDHLHHFGLQLIVERVSSSGGHVVVDSRLDAGTLVVAALPRHL